MAEESKYFEQYERCWSAEKVKVWQICARKKAKVSRICATTFAICTSQAAIREGNHPSWLSQFGENSFFLIPSLFRCVSISWFEVVRKSVIHLFSDFQWFDVMWCDVMWFDVMWCDVMRYDFSKSSDSSYSSKSSDSSDSSKLSDSSFQWVTWVQWVQWV